MRITKKSRRKDPATIEDRRGDAPGTVYMSEPPKPRPPESRQAKALRRKQEISIDNWLKRAHKPPKPSTKGTPAQNKAAAKKARSETQARSKKMSKKVERRERWQKRGLSFPVSMSKLRYLDE